MNSRSLKAFIVAAFCIGLAVAGLNGWRVGAYAVGMLPSKTGAPGEPNCTQCHSSFTVNSGPGTLSLTLSAANYSPNQTITVTVNLAQSGRTRYGFQVTALDSSGKKAGDFTITDASRTVLGQGVVNGGVRQYVNHTNSGSSSGTANQISWSFTWKAPASSAGTVTFYVAGNAANNNGSENGDYIYTKTVTLDAAPALANFTSVSAASFSTSVTTAANSILAGFGTNLSTNVVVASTTPLPTTLDGTTVEIKDITNTARLAPLFFVAPTQINYAVPDGTVNGAATVTISRNGTPVSQGTITVDTVGPGLFTANANGQGVPAAVVLRVRGTAQTFEALSQATNGVFSPTPIDLGPTGDDLYLILFGTGIRAAQQNQATCTIGGTAAPVAGFAAAPGFTGLDQINVGPIPRSLAGRGLVDVVLTVAGKAANTVQINIK